MDVAEFKRKFLAVIFVWTVPWAFFGCAPMTTHDTCPVEICGQP
jgi:hypothetical protein